MSINKSELAELKSKWDNDKKLDNRSILYSKLEDKYSDIVYKKILHKEIDKESWENFKNLVNLRNLLVHFKAEWQKELPKKDNQYKIVHLGKLCKQNPFMEDIDNPVFPKKLLCSNCAVWSINVSTKFRTMFSNDLSDSNIGLSLRTDINKILQEYSFETS